MSKAALIEQDLQVLEPHYLELEDESDQHSKGVETHYRVVIVSPCFAGLNRVQRHQRVYACLASVMDSIHALALYTYTPEEWADGQPTPESPVCAGGSQ